ncbi:glycosyltransferase family 4 protein [bacterium]|nr:glycosyltransferase family 4 protein [bacterium]
MNETKTGPVLLLLPYLSLSGLELFGIRFAQDLRNRGIPVSIGAPKNSRIYHSCLTCSIPFVAVQNESRFNPFAIKRIANILTTLKPRAVIAFRTQIIYPLFFFFFVKRIHVPILLFYRIGAGNQPRLDPIHRVLFRHVAAVVPNSLHVQNKILAKWAISPEKVVCIKSGIDANKYRFDNQKRTELRSILKIPDSAFLIGNTGRIHPEKGSQDLLELVFKNGGISRDREIHLVFVGSEFQPGYSEFLRKTAANLGGENFLHILPFKTDIESVYSAFDLFVLPVKSHETYAYVVLEAMASQVVPVVPKIGGIKEMFLDKIEGFFYSFRDLNDLERVLFGATKMEPPKLKEMGIAARRRVEENASWPSMMNQYLALLKKSGVEIP